MGSVPALLQLCAEALAIQARNGRKLRRFLKRMHLTPIPISFIQSKKYRGLDFSTFIKIARPNTTIIPTTPKMGTNHNFKITVGSEKAMYISTISDLGINMLKLDFPRGEYIFSLYIRGYLLKMQNYTPEIEHTTHVFTTRKGYKGLAGTFWNGLTKDKEHMRIFNHYISEYVRSDYWHSTIEQPYRVVIDGLEDHHNLPVLFYLTQKINHEDLSKISLTCPGEIRNLSNVRVCWYVRHSEKGQIGIAVKQKFLYDMMGDNPGICLFVSDGFRAIGNFDYDLAFNWRDMFSDDGYNTRATYKCEYEQCSCDTLRPKSPRR